jgi:hypothetical protein
MIPVDPAFGALCSNWYDRDIAWLYGQRRIVSSNKHMMLACPVYGQMFAEMYGGYSVPSIVAGQNAYALRDKATIVVFTDKYTFRTVMSACHTLENKFKIEFIPRLIPDEVMEVRNNNIMNTMWILGMVHSIAMQMCVRWGMGFSMTVPDVAYSNGYFARLDELKQDHDVILQSTITADMEGLFTELDKAHRMQDGSIDVSARQLGMLGYKHLHKQNQQYIMNNATFPDAVPYTQFQMWRMFDHIQIYTGFSNPVWLSHEQCMKVASSSLSTLDTRIPQLKVNDFYIPTLDDDMLLVDVSTDAKAANAPLSNRDDWIDGAWERLAYDPAYMKYRKRAHTVYIGKHNDGYVAPSHVEQTQAKIDDMLLQERANSMYRRINGKVIPSALAPWPIHVLP